MSDPNSKLPEINYIGELAEVFKRFQLDELEIETGEQRILMRRGAEITTSVVHAQPVVAAPLVAAPTAAVASPAGPAAEPEAEGDFITSPFVGTFYSRPRPDADPFIAPGATIAAGQTVCIVEAMKLFNEIEAEFGCVVEEVLVGEQQPVEFGTKLFRVRRL